MGLDMYTPPRGCCRVLKSGWHAVVNGTGCVEAVTIGSTILTISNINSNAG